MLGNKELNSFIREYLEKYPHLRDDDYKLLATVWKVTLFKRGLNIKIMTALELLQFVAEGKLPHMSSIVRTRSKLQEHNPQLRGTKYNERQAYSKKVKKQVQEYPYCTK